MAESVSKQRARRLSDFDLFPRAQPAVTYGKRVKRLPLHGTHFKRLDTYEIPLDDDKGPPVLSKPNVTLKRQPDPDSLPSSENGLSAVHGDSVGTSLSLRKSAALPKSISRTGIHILGNSTNVPSQSEALRAKKSVVKSAAKFPAEPAWEYKIGKATGKDISDSADSTRRKAKAASNNRDQRHPRSILAEPLLVRRLPVNELILLPSRSEEDTSSQSSSASGAQIKDSIEVTCNPSGRHQTLPVSAERVPKAPLTSIRKRLKTDKFIHKSVVASRSKSKGQSSRLTISSSAQNLGDGFSSSEMENIHRQKVKKQRRSQKPLVFGFRVLQLQSGPLPDVKFESRNRQLKTTPCNNGEQPDTHHTQIQPGTQEGTEAKTKSVSAPQKVNFRDGVLSDEVRAQLSSVSAPKRVSSISSDGSDEEDFVVTDDESEDETAGRETAAFDEAGNESEEQLMIRSFRRTPPSNQRARWNSAFWKRNSAVTVKGMTRKGSVTLDFRRTLTPSISSPRTQFSKRRLMEVNETVLEKPEAINPSCSQVSALATLSVLESNDATAKNQTYNPHAVEEEAVPRQFPRPHYPRSIVGRSNPVSQNKDVSPERTEANTRSNSIITLDGTNGSFASAAKMLDPNSNKHKHEALRHEIIKQSANQLHSNYLARKDNVIEDPDSDYDVFGTSSERPHPHCLGSADRTRLNILKRNSEAVWTSNESLPQLSIDLRTLTRSVSRKNGTLSQAAWRRHSRLQFQSPTKVRVV